MFIIQYQTKINKKYRYQKIGSPMSFTSSISDNVIPKLANLKSKLHNNAQDQKPQKYKRRVKKTWTRRY